MIYFRSDQHTKRTKDKGDNGPNKEVIQIESQAEIYKIHSNAYPDKVSDHSDPSQSEHTTNEFQNFEKSKSQISLNIFSGVEMEKIQLSVTITISQD